MSFESRQKKRRYKRIEADARRARHAPETARRWFLTVAKKPGRCSRCGDGFERGADVFYRHEPREVRCQRCGLRCEDSKRARPSIRWERAKRKAAA